MITEISSLRHPLVQEWKDLREKKEIRLEKNLVFLSGEKMIRELSKQIVLEAFITCFPQEIISAKQTYIVTQEILQKITGLPSPDGFAAVAPYPAPQSCHGKKRILILDQLQDPGNLGTLLRTAFAFNWDCVLMTPGTVDPFNDKALRANKGALFFLPYDWMEPDAISEFLTQQKYSAYLADLEGMLLSKTKPVSPFALILSNEGSGPRVWAEKLAKKIAIPMHNKVESLNVAVSGAILLYELASHE